MVRQGYSITQVPGLKQTTILAPQLQQGVRVLQLSSQELQNEIDSALLSNPFLEKMEVDSDFELTPNTAVETRDKRIPDPPGDTHTIQGYSATPRALNRPNSGTTSGAKLDAGANSNFDFLDEISSELTLHAFLRQQANATPLQDKQHFILEILIDCVNDNGYLRGTIDEIVGLAMPDYVIRRNEVAKVITVLQGFEPVGVGARTSSECLLLQLEDLPCEIPSLELARQIVSRSLLLVAQKKIPEVALEHGKTEAEIQSAIALIRQLNPFPGMLYTAQRIETIAPDLIVKKAADNWVVRLNPNLAPAIGLHSESDDLLKLAKGHTGYQKLKQTLQDARLLLSNIEKRYQTILRVATLVIERQADSLEQGEAALKPLSQRQIADLLNIHVSTVSRAVNDKYILTPAGVVELRSFFCSSISCKDAEDISSRAIQAQIKALIDQEPGEKPLSDNKITDVLKKRGIQVARRTVMKYREQLGIPASPQRRATT